jgi:hypothetical protein
MRVTITPAVSQYLMDNSTVYPYSNLRATRNSFYCKWVMMQGHDRGSTEYFPVLANSLPNRVLMELIVSERGVPFPPELSSIMDSMYWWGKNKNVAWYDEVIYLLGVALDNDTEDDMMELVRAMISIQVKAEIHDYFTDDSIVADLLWINWVFWFNATYNDGPKSFHGRTLYSIEYIRRSMAQVNYYAR